VLEVVLRARAEDTVEDPLAPLEDPGDVQELLARLRLELAPELVRAPRERDVVGMLEVREADDPREPVRRAVLVQEVELLEPEHAPAPTREVVEGGAPHATDSDHDDVVPLHGPDPNRGWLNGPMPTAVENLGENRVRFTVDVSSDQVKHAVEHAMSDLSESVKIPGFRKGKIPTPVLVSRLGKDRIYAEAVDSHIGGWFWSAASRNRVRPVSDPQYDFELPANADDGWSFVATVEVQALPELADWTTLEVPRAEVEVPDEAVAAEIEAMRESVAELAPAGERPAQPGDTLLVDLVDADGEAQPDTVLELGGGRLAPEIESGLIGATAGETKQIDFPLADGSSAQVEITVREVQEKVLPEIDDELARAASEFDTIAELRASIEGTLREQLDAEIDAAFRISAVDELVRASAVQPALPLVRTRAADLLTGFARSLERRGISLETYLSASGGNVQDLERQMVLEAAVSVARELALEALAEKAGLEISDEDVKAYIREEAAAAGEADAEGVIEDVWAHGQQESIREDLRLRAALDRLVADVKPIAPELAEARDKLWTPDKEKPEGETKLWTPGSKEN
jgi:trigger factor